MAVKQRPNIVLMISHDVGRHLHCYGVPTVQSPNLDAIAAGGVRFARSFCTAPQCSPSRASIVTGRFPHSNGVMGLTQAQFAWDLHPGERHLARILRDAGYHTAVSNGYHESRSPHEKLGFAERLDVGGMARQVGAGAAEWIAAQGRGERPFYLQLQFIETHRLVPADTFGYPPDRALGVTVPEYLVDDFGARDEFMLFQGAVKALDEGVGLVAKALDDAGLADDTLVVFMADHGIPFPRAKCSVYDPGIEAAFLMRWPGGGRVEAGAVFDPMVSNVDFLPTVMDLLDLPVAGNVQGRSLAPLLRGESYEARREIFAELTYHGYYEPRRCIRTDTHKLIANFTTGHLFLDPTQCWRPKTVTKNPVDPMRAFHPPVELYDLAADPLEFNNLAGDEAHAATTRELLHRLHAWMVETQDPLLDGIPLSPMHRMAMAALERGQVFSTPEEL